MSNQIFITRVVLRNYKSIGKCDVKLGPLTYLVGSNGSGKSNFVDALHLVRDSLAGSLDNALSERGGLNEVRRRSSGRPTNFGIRLEFQVADQKGHYSFNVGALTRGYEVQNEECAISGASKSRFFVIRKGTLVDCSEPTFPAVTADRLALVAASGLTAFRPVFDALTSMGFYNLNPKVMRELQKPQDGRLLKASGENIASVIGHLGRIAPTQKELVESYLRTVAPMIQGVERKPVGPMETIEFRQDMEGAKHLLRFSAQNMSDGTLRALGVLVALFQGNPDFSPTLVGVEEPETALHPAASEALREALIRASENTQIIVTSHSPDLLDDLSIDPDSLLSVVSNLGETHIASLDDASKIAMRECLFSAGELLRLNQLHINAAEVFAQEESQASLFGSNEL